MRTIPLTWLSDDKTFYMRRNATFYDDGRIDVSPDPAIRLQQPVKSTSTAAGKGVKLTPCGAPCGQAPIYMWLGARWIGVPDPRRAHSARQHPLRALLYAPLQWLVPPLPAPPEGYVGCGCLYKAKTGILTAKTAWTILKNWWRT